MKTLTWEGVEWTKEVQIPHIGRMVKCDGCSSIVGEAARYSSPAVEAITGAQYKVFARWCADCVEVVKAG